MYRRLAIASRRCATRACVHSRATRPPLPPVSTGWAAHCGWLERTLVRLPRFVDYSEQSVFAPSLSRVHHALMFVGLQAPQQLDLDVTEFLRGAAVATQRVLDDAFVQAVSNGPPVSQRLESCCLPHCVAQLQTAAQRRSTGPTRTREIDVERKNLTRVQYTCLPAEGDEENLIEQLQLQVEVRTLERLERVESQNREELPSSSVDLQQRNVYVARFTSVVNDPDLLDWRLASLALRTRGKPQATMTPTPAMH